MFRIKGIICIMNIRFVCSNFFEHEISSIEQCFSNFLVCGTLFQIEIFHGNTHVFLSWQHREIKKKSNMDRKPFLRLGIPIMLSM